MNKITTKITRNGRRQASKQAGTARAQLAPSPEDLARANRWRQALLRLLAKHQLSPAGLARRIGAPNPNAIYNFLNRISHSLSQVTLERICVALPGTGMDDLFGLVRPRPATCLIVAEAVTGVAQDSFMLPPAQQMLLSLPGAWGHDPELFGVRVGLPGAGRLYPAGSLLLCRPYSGGGEDLVAGCRVIVQQPLGADMEVTVRELIAGRSKSGRMVAYPDGLRWPAGPSAILLGVVIVSWQPELAPHTP